MRVFRVYFLGGKSVKVYAILDHNGNSLCLPFKASSRADAAKKWIEKRWWTRFADQKFRVAMRCN